jgi:hypothetical protein
MLDGELECTKNAWLYLEQISDCESEGKRLTASGSPERNKLLFASSRSEIPDNTSIFRFISGRRRDIAASHPSTTKYGKMAGTLSPAS